MSSYLKESSVFANAIKELDGKKVLVLGHRRPDGDCIGSQVALTRVLQGLGIDTKAVNQDSVPRTLRKFIGDTPFFRPEEIEGDSFTVITVDCADHGRVGNELCNRFPDVHLNIDHHVSNNNYARTNLVLSNAAATGEILAKFFLDSALQIDPITADALYLGIATDTGQFCYSGTNGSVFDVCRKLCEFGASPSRVAHELYEKEKPGRVQLLQRFLSTFRMEHKNRVCIGMLKDSFFEETDTKPEDSENFVDYTRSMEGVDIGVLIEERNGQIKGSFRAKNESFRVDLLAKEFNGGGHACAAGFNLEGNLDDFYPLLVEKIGHYLSGIKL